MAEGRRSKKQRAKLASAGKPAAFTRPLSVTIITGITESESGVDLRPDVDLVRSALLYADHVDLMSPGAVLLGQMAGISDLSPRELVDFILAFDDVTLERLGVSEAAGLRSRLTSLLPTIRESRSAARNRLGGRAAMEHRRVLEAQLSPLGQSLEGYREQMERLWSEAGAEDLGLALNSGALTFNSRAAEAVAASDFAERFTGLIEDVLLDSRHQVMFDEQMGRLTGHLLDENPELGERIARRRPSAGLGSGLMARLPAFPKAGVEAILQAREDLAEPLLRYRKVVSELTQLLTSPVHDTPGLQLEIEELWHGQVEPTLHELTKGISWTRLAKEAALDVASDGRVWSFSGVGATIQFGLANMAVLGTSLLAIGGSVAGASAISSFRRERAAVGSRRTHGLYYLLEVNRRINR